MRNVLFILIFIIYFILCLKLIVVGDTSGFKLIEFNEGFKYNSEAIIGLLIIVGISILVWSFDHYANKDYEQHNENIKINEVKKGELKNTSTSNFVIVTPKSKGIAILLVLIGGPLGLFYSTTKGALIMTLVAISGVIIFYAFLFNMEFIFFKPDSLFLLSASWLIGILVYLLICVIWTVNAVEEYNKLLMGANK